MAPLLLLAFALSAQDKPPEKCTLSGTVVSAVTGEPLGKVDIALEPTARGNRVASVTTSDSEGKFAMVDLEPGSYHLIGRRNGYLDTSYGARRPEGDGTVLRLEAGQALPDLKLKLIPFGVIAGTVRDSDGEPLVDARVTVARRSYEHGKSRLDGYESAETDDLGQYRVRLKPGKYYVGVRPDPDRQVRVDHSKGKAAAESPVPTVYPGSADASLAAPIEVAMGARVNGIDITMARARIYTVSGRVVTAAGSGASGANIGLRGNEGGLNLDAAPRTTTRNANGDFELRGVQAGHYQLSATRTGEVTSVPLDVTGNMEGVRVVLGQGAKVRGAIVMEGEGPVKPKQWQLYLSVDGRDGYMLNPENEQFAAQENVAPGRYEVHIMQGFGPGTYIKGIRAGDADVLIEGLTVLPGAAVQFEVRLASDAGKVEGTVTDKSDQPGVGATVVLVPESKLRSRSDLFQTATTDQYGHFEFTNVAPGEYKVFAWDDVEPGIWNDPDFLREHEKKGEPVTVGAKGNETVKVKM